MDSKRILITVFIVGIVLLIPITLFVVGQFQEEETEQVEENKDEDNNEETSSSKKDDGKENDVVNKKDIEKVDNKVANELNIVQQKIDQIANPSVNSGTKSQLQQEIIAKFENPKAGNSAKVVFGATNQKQFNDIQKQLSLIKFSKNSKFTVTDVKQSTAGKYQQITFKEIPIR